MEKRIKYNGIPISKKEAEVINFIEIGSNNFWDSYYVYSHRKKRIDRPTLTITTWFNKVVKSLHNKNLLNEIPFVLQIGGGFVWQNPGINASKANFECLTLQEDTMELKSEMNKIL